ncbi:MAG: HD domain-containing protein [Deltaproteobacteria bacterium]|nr:HD domain-containing protein [Deltaproteobacteria bacterium]
MQCPGQDSRYWESAAIFEVKCPTCQNLIEFFKDDSSRTCRACGNRMLNPKIDFGCAAYCPHAEQCLGSLPDGLKASSGQSLKERVAIEMKRYFGKDFKRIGHASKVAHYAEEINRTEQGDPAVVLICAYLHDIGIKEAERKFNSSSARYQHQEGPPVARDILTGLHADRLLIDEVCDIIGHHHHPRQEETMNFKVLYDADLIVNLDEEQRQAPSPRAQLEKIIGKSFLTGTGQRIARQVLLTEKKG